MQFAAQVVLRAPVIERQATVRRLSVDVLVWVSKQNKIGGLNGAQNVAVGASNGRPKKSQDDNHHQGHQRQ